MQLAATYSQHEQTEAASQTYKQLIDLAEQPAPAKQFLLANRIATTAVYQEARLLLSVDNTEDEPENTGRNALSDSTNEAIQRLVTSAAGKDTGLTLHLKALLALHENQPDNAVAYFKEAITASLSLRQTDRVQILDDAIATVISMSNNQGLLRGWLEQSLELRPNDVLKRLQLIQLNLNAAQRGIPGRDYYSLALQQARYFSQQENTIQKAIGAWTNAQVYANRDKDWSRALAEAQDYTIEQLQAFSPRAAVTMAEWFQKTGDSNQARALLYTHLNARPTDVDAAVRYANLLNSDAERQNVLDNLIAAGISDQALASAQTLIMGTTAERRALLNDSIQQRREPTLTSSYAEMHAAWLKDDLETTLSLANARIEVEPTDQIAWSYKLFALFTKKDRPSTQAFASEAAAASGVEETIWRGRIALFDRDYQRARVLLERGTESSPTNGLAKANLGNALVGLGDHENAIDAFNESLDITGIQQGRTALYGLYQVNTALGDNQAALQALRALAQYRLYYTAQEWLTYAEHEARIGEPNQALALRETLATQYPQLFSLRRQLAITYAQQSSEIRQDDPERSRRLGEKSEAAIDSLIESQGSNTANAIAKATIKRTLHNDEAGFEYLNQYLQSQSDGVTHQDYLALGDYYFDLNEHEKAIAAYNSAIRVEPKDTLPATRVNAYRMLSLGKHSDALRYLENLATAFPDDQTITAARVDALSRLQRFEEATALTGQLDPTTAAVPITAAKAASAQQDFTTAATVLDEALNSEQDFSDLATSTLLRMRALNRLNKATSNSTQVNKELIDQNRDDLLRAVNLSPDDTVAQRLLIQNYQQSGEHDRAIEEAEMLLEKQPAPTNLAALAQSLFATGQHARAASLIIQATESDPNNPQWHRQLAQIHVAQGNLVPAAESWATALQHSNNTQDLLQTTQAFIATDQSQRVLNLVDEYPQRFSQSSDLQSLRGQALAMSGNRGASEQIFAKAIILSTTPKQYLRTTYFITDDNGLGLELGIAFLERDESKPEDWRAWATGRAYLRLAKYQQAADAMAKAWPVLAESPVSLALAQSLGIAYQQTGEALRSKEAYETALLLKPNNAETLNNFAYLLTTSLDDPASALPLVKKASELTGGGLPAIQDTLGLTYFHLGPLRGSYRNIRDANKQAT